jgi:hypothetical protein
MLHRPAHLLQHTEVNEVDDSVRVAEVTSLWLNVVTERGMSTPLDVSAYRVLTTRIGQLLSLGPPQLPRRLAVGHINFTVALKLSFEEPRSRDDPAGKYITELFIHCTTAR